MYFSDIYNPRTRKKEKKKEGKKERKRENKWGKKEEISYLSGTYYLEHMVAIQQPN